MVLLTNFRCLKRLFIEDVKQTLYNLHHRFSTVHFNASDTDVEEIIETTLDKSGKTPRTTSVLTTRREALSLYREIMRITALFDWPDQRGVLWRDVLRDSARKEFEAARHEKDPEIVNRLLVVGRDSVHQIAEKFIQKRQEIYNINPSSPPPPT